jgi:precorrin-8X/cobalt-precorrin-8 methylmutase
MSVRDIRLGPDIEAESFRIIDAEVPEPRPFAGDQWLVVRRMIHTTAYFELLSLASFHPRAVEAGVAEIGRAHV